MCFQLIIVMIMMIMMMGVDDKYIYDIYRVC